MADPVYEVKVKSDGEETPAPEPAAGEPGSDVPTPEPVIPPAETPPAETDTDKVSEEVSKSVIGKIGDALGLTKEEEEALPTDPAELKKVVDTQVAEALELKEKQQQEEVESAQEAQTKQVDQIILGWHTEYNQLAKSGRVPVIQDANNQDDPGVKARRQLILGVGEIIKKDRDEGVNRTPSLSEVMLNNPNAAGGVPGANLPISGSTVARETPATYSNKEVKSKSFQQIASEG